MAKRFDISIAKFAGQQLGLVTRSQLLGAGMSQRAIRHRASSGSLVKLFPGVYALSGTEGTLKQHTLACLLAVGDGAAISHQSAGEFWKLDGVAAELPHVLVEHDRKLRLKGAVLHRTRTLVPSDAVRHPPFRVTSPARTLMDLAAVLNADQLEDALDDALRRRLVTVRILLARIGENGHRGASGLAGLRRLLEARSGIRPSGSPLETRFRRRLTSAGLPVPVSQHEVRDERGRLIARVDFAYPEARLAIEVDGYAHHSGRKQWEADLTRQNRLITAGWRFLRFSSRDLGDPAMAHAIQTALIGSGEPSGHKMTVKAPRKSKSAARS